MSAYLISSVFPDVNVWIALSSTRHSHHKQALRWFQSLEDVQLVFCRFTQLGFLRLLTTEAAMGVDMLTQAQAWREYDAWLQSGAAVLLEEPRQLEQVFRSLSAKTQSSPKEWADSYLAAFSITSGIRLVTFDRALKARTADALLLRP